MYSIKCSRDTSAKCQYCGTKFDDQTNQNNAEYVVDKINTLESNLSTLQETINKYKSMIPKDNGNFDVLGQTVNKSLQDLYENEKSANFSEGCYAEMLNGIVKNAEEQDRQKNSSDCSTHERGCSAKEEGDEDK